RVDCSRRILADCRQARVHDEPVTVRPMIFQVRTGACDQVEMRFSGGTEDGHERNGLALVLPDPDHAEAQLRSVRFRDGDARPRPASGGPGTPTAKRSGPASVCVAVSKIPTLPPVGV